MQMLRKPPREAGQYGTNWFASYAFVLCVSALVGLVALPASLAGQIAEQGAESSDEPQVALLSSVTGPLSRDITTAYPDAQAYFDQGLQMMYAFTIPNALESFEEAERRDPDCAMCYFGEAWARGPFLNGRMRPSNAPLAYAAIQKAIVLAEEAGTPVERALINAMALRYTEEEDADLRPRLDSMYSRAMAEVYEDFPDDLDVGTLYAESLILLNPTRANYRLGDPFVQSFHEVLEAVLAKDITHPGACHIYIHATEATEEPGRAEDCADLLGASIPGSSHINHMPSHTYNRIGRWNSAVRSNIDAWHSDQRVAFEEGVSYAATHNLHMLLFAGSMAGQGAVSLLAAEAYADQVEGGVFYEALVMLRYGWFDKILALEDETPSPDRPIQLGLFQFAQGYAHLRAGEADLARVYLARVEEAAATLPETTQIRGATAARLLGTAAGILEGEILREEGLLDEAIRVFEDAVELYVPIPYAEPEALNVSPRHWLGAALLEAGRAEEAEQVYRDALVQHPHNGWSIYGLEQALRAQGRDAEADEAKAWFREAWAYTDTLIRSSRF
jgi:tetratricopeptide (TPR) repeat protein